jgi:pimeloyl-ACP methyl ester carboxylesterase
MLDRPSSTSTAQGSAVTAPLVMLPGTLCDGRVFAPVLDRLDRRGHVLPLAGADTARDVAGLILAAAPDRMSLCGFSLGAIVALEIIAQAPQRVERLALIGCNPGVLAKDAADARMAMTQDEFLGAEAGPHLELLSDMAHSTSPEIFAQQTSITLSRADSRGRLRQIDVPTLVLCGKADRVCPPEMSRTIARAIPGSRLAVIAGAGHYVTLERPEAVADELMGWLARPASPFH